MARVQAAQEAVHAGVLKVKSNLIDSWEWVAGFQLEWVPGRDHVCGWTVWESVQFGRRLCNGCVQSPAHGLQCSANAFQARCCVYATLSVAFPKSWDSRIHADFCILRFSCVRGLCDWCMQVQRPESSAQELVICLPHQHICRSKGADAITPSNKIALPRPNVTQQTVASRFLSRALTLISAETPLRPHHGHCIL